MEGKIFQISSQVSYFIKGNSSKLILLIGGLGDILFSIEYFKYLWNKFSKYMLCLPTMRSSGNSFGSTVIWDDVEDIKLILNHIVSNNKINEIYLIGHSTGCQDILCLFKSGLNKEFPIKKCILQGPVSDRDYVKNNIKLLDEIKRIEKEYSIIYKDWNFSEIKNSKDISKYLYDDKYPLLIRRFISLFSRLGDEDWFSFDLCNKELKEIYSVIDVPFLLVFSLEDQYVNYNKDEYKELIERIKFCNDNINVYMLNDDHYIEKSMDEFYQVVNKFINEKN